MAKPRVHREEGKWNAVQCDPLLREPLFFLENWRM